jgi:hypothetical protein
VSCTHHTQGCVGLARMSTHPFFLTPCSHVCLLRTHALPHMRTPRVTASPPQVPIVVVPSACVHASFPLPVPTSACPFPPSLQHTHHLQVPCCRWCCTVLAPPSSSCCLVGRRTRI